LPRWRGAAPVQRAILAGDIETGITIMQMDTGLDTGDILYQKSCTIGPDDTADTLYNRLALLGSESIHIVLDMIVNNSLKPVRQNDSGITYAHKILKSEARIDWHKPAIEIDRMVRAYIPAPVAYTVLNNTTIRVWQVAILDQTVPGIPPGNIINYSANGIDIMSGDKIIRILKLQLPGKKVMTSRDFFNGNPGFWPEGQHAGT
jgi:methionyl-tRNA formyltransferase